MHTGKVLKKLGPEGYFLSVFHFCVAWQGAWWWHMYGGVSPVRLSIHTCYNHLPRDLQGDEEGVDTDDKGDT
uniref:Uncharacterized protein n=1 Tax=Romanomermis culicivorax TaxID=13658 RepID=A0A915JKZ8_ROMCU